MWFGSRINDPAAKSGAASQASGRRPVVRKTRTSLLKLFLRTIYWLIILAVVGVVVYIGFEAGYAVYKNTSG